MLFVPMDRETSVYLILVVICMFTGFLDDASRMPWGQFRKGFLDLCVAALTAWNFMKFNSTDVELALFHVGFSMPGWLFAVLAVILVWVSVNVTNCADGVDGLSGTLAIITLASFYVIDNILGKQDGFSLLILMFIICLLGYLWYNAAPSKLLMGDAGSRAMGIFISIVALKSGSPFLYLPVGIVFILDGGLGLLKVALIRGFKIHILKNIRTPLHDHVRKVMGWSNTQTDTRFAIIQIVVSTAVVCFLLL